MRSSWKRLTAAAAPPALAATLLAPSAARADSTPECNNGPVAGSTECGEGSHANGTGTGNTAVGAGRLPNGAGTTPIGAPSIPPSAAHYPPRYDLRRAPCRKRVYKHVLISLASRSLPQNKTHKH